MKKNSSNRYYFFDSKTGTPSKTCTSGNTTGCKYGWLYDRTSTSCTTYGCLNNSDVSTCGYWSASSDANFTSDAWAVNNAGTASELSVNDPYFGIRPVIEVLKSNLK